MSRLPCSLRPPDRRASTTVGQMFRRRSKRHEATPPPSATVPPVAVPPTSPEPPTISEPPTTPEPPTSPEPASTPVAPAASPTPPVDLDVPVSNPELLARLVECVRTGTWDQPTMQAQRDAVYVLATQISGPGIVDGVMQAGTKITLFHVVDDQDRPAVAAFTDWDALRAVLGDDPSWSGMIETGEGVLALAGSAGYVGGVVINPGSPESQFALTPERLDRLLAQTQPASAGH